MSNDTLNTIIMGLFFDALELPTNAGKYRLLSKAAKKVIGSITNAGEVLHYANHIAEGIEEHEAAYIQTLCAGAIQATAYQPPAPKYGTWEDVQQALVSREKWASMTHEDWLEVIHAAKGFYPKTNKLDSAVFNLFYTLHEQGVNHGRHYMMVSLAWSAIASMTYDAVRLADYPDLAGDIQAAMALYGVYMDYWLSENGAAVEEGDASEFMDGYDADAERKASTTVTFTRDTKGAKDTQRSPFPQDLSELFNKEVSKYLEVLQGKNARNASLTEAAKAKTRAIMSGRKIVAAPSAKEQALARYMAKKSGR